MTEEITVEGILLGAKSKLLQEEAVRAAHSVELRLKKYEPLIRDYIVNGYTLREAGKRYGYKGARIYQIAKDLAIPKLAAPLETQRLAKKLQYYRDLKSLEACKCFTCVWILQRIKRLKKNGPAGA